MVYTWPFWFNLLYREQEKWKRKKEKRSHTQILSAMIAFQSLKLGHDDRMEDMRCWRPQSTEIIQDLCVFCKSPWRRQGGRVERALGGNLPLSCGLGSGIGPDHYLATSSFLFVGFRGQTGWSEKRLFIHLNHSFIEHIFIECLMCVQYEKTLVNMVLTLIELRVGETLIKYSQNKYEIKGQQMLSRRTTWYRKIV